MNNNILGWVQVIATVFVAATFVVYLFQLRAMRAASAGQNILTLVSFLQTPDVRSARHRLLVITRGKAYDAWDHEDRAAASLVASSYDIAGITIRLNVVRAEPFLDNWGPSIVGCYQILQPFIAEMRRAMGARYWDDIVWLQDQVRKKYPAVVAMELPESLESGSA